VIAQFAQDRAVRAFWPRIAKTRCVLYNLVYRSSSVERSIGLSFTTQRFTVRRSPTRRTPHRQSSQKAQPTPAGAGMPGGCTAAGGLPSGAMALALLGVLRRRRRR
jgi:uncharacterized protein (TIGR03382 family)